jgi:phosphohistidine phosphatase
MAAILEIYLVRHAIAAERGPKYPDDRKRPLTPEGIKRFKEAVRGLVALDLELDVILTSPLTRAEETAALLSAGLKKRAPVELVEALAPGGKFTAIVDAVTKQAKRHRRRVALVGHEPDLGETAARWLAARGHVEFRKGAVCAIDVDSATPAGPGTLRWLLPPRLLRRLAP